MVTPHLSNVGARGKLLQFSKTVGLGKGKHKLAFHQRLTQCLAGHLKEAHEVLVLAIPSSSTNHIHVMTRVLSLDVRIYKTTRGDYQWIL